ncbi:hypothetical protein ACDN41_11950 [Priestia aryabhattai]|uniref:hypothetical protein n=1 Tax=Priestia aryabhattai TaxID=412384 RepID=UPI0035320EE2
MKEKDDLGMDVVYEYTQLTFNDNDVATINYYQNGKKDFFTMLGRGELFIKSRKWGSQVKETHTIDDLIDLVEEKGLAYTVLGYVDTNKIEDDELRELFEKTRNTANEIRTILNKKKKDNA